MKPLYSALLFDLGGVLLDIDFSKPVEAFRALGFDHFEQQYTQHTASPLFEQLETGKISEAGFYDALRSIGSVQHADSVLEKAWCSILGSYRKNSLEFVLALRKQYDVYLLSNTNAIHQRAFFSLLQEQMGKPDLNPYFDQAFYSHEMGCRKPDPASFLFVVSAAGFKAEECLFVDDTHANIVAARHLGFHSLHLQPGQCIEMELKHLL